MRAQRLSSAFRMVTIAGLVIGAIGIAVLWAAGTPFPFYPPPGILILLGGALFIGLAPWRWGPAVGTALGVFIIVGFLLSGGLSNLVGSAGLGVAVGQGIQLAGVLLALITGVLALWVSYRQPE